MRVFLIICVIVLCFSYMRCSSTEHRKKTINTEGFPTITQYPDLDKRELLNRFQFYSRDRTPIACNLLVEAYIKSIPDTLFNKYFIFYQPILGDREPSYKGYIVRFKDRYSFKEKFNIKFESDGDITYNTYGNY